MKVALAADKTSKPREISPDEDSRLAAILASWKISTLIGNLPVRTIPTPVPDVALARPPTDAITVTTQAPKANDKDIGCVKPRPRSLTSESSSAESKTIKKSNATPFEPKNFTIAAAAATAETLKNYPGKVVSSKSLAVEDLLGSRIFSSMIGGGSDMMTYPTRNNQHFRRGTSGAPTAAEAEALTLDRLIHLEMLVYSSLKEALQERTSLEVALRRLYAILHVEKAMNTGMHTDKREAWM